jgi:hypothetical protein
VAYGLDELTGIVTKKDWINTSDISGTYYWYHHYTIEVPQGWFTDNTPRNSGDILVAILVKPGDTATVNVNEHI